MMLLTTFTSLMVAPAFSPPCTGVLRTGLKPNSQTVPAPEPEPIVTVSPRAALRMDAAMSGAAAMFDLACAMAAAR